MHFFLEQTNIKKIYISLPTSTPLRQKSIASLMWNSRCNVPNDLFLGKLALEGFAGVLSMTEKQ